MIRRLLRVAVGAAAIGWFVDRYLATRSDGLGPDAIRSIVVIDAPIERVWETLADIEGQPRWMTDLKAVRLLTPGPVGVGTRAEGVVRIFGMETLDPIAITEFDPPRRFAIRHEGRFVGEGTIELEPGADTSTTVVRWAETIVPPFLPYLSARLMAPILARVFQADLDRLRDQVEASSRDS